MKTKTYKSLGLEVKVSVPSTMEEFDKLAKREGACLDEATNNAVYRGYLGNFRADLLHGREADAENGIAAFKGLEEATGVERLTKDSGKKNAKGEAIEVYDETEEEYKDRVVAGGRITVAELQQMADELTSITAFDPSARERKPSAPKKLAEKWLTHAKAILKKGQIEELNKRLQKQIAKTFEVSGDAEKDAIALGWLVKEYSDSLAEQTISKLSA